MGNIVAIVGRPNVGKSTLFNRLTQTRQAIVNEEAGTTRDRQYGKAEWTGKEFSLIDTGGWVINSDDVFEEEINKQVKVALEEADVILFVVDVLNGVTDLDNEVAAILRRAKKPVIVVANKADNFELHPSSAEFYSFGLGDPFCISAINGSCTGDLLDKIVATLPDDKQEMLEEELPRIAIIGRPNAGKSSLINAFIGEDRHIVTDIAGTTRDSIYTKYNKFGLNFYLVDTAGIRKKGKVNEDLEYYSVIRSIRAIENSDVCVLMLDATRGIESQDLNIFSLVQKNKKGLVVCVNKWDLVEDKSQKVIDTFTSAIRERLAPFTDFPILFISALTKQRILKVLETAKDVYENRQRRVPTAKLNEIMLPIIENYPPPAWKGKYIKIKYITQLPAGQVPLWSKEHFDAMLPIMKMLANAGQRAITTSIMHKPWAGQTEDHFDSMVTRIKKIDGTWVYSYDVFDKWVEFMMNEVGIKDMISCYTMIPWALTFDYYDEATSRVQFINVKPGDAEYTEYWGSFLKDFSRHLRKKGWFEKTAISMDERPMEAMREAIKVIKQADPEFKITLAGNYHPEIQSDLYYLSIPYGHKFPENVKAERERKGQISTVYTCCSEAFPNTFTFSDPAEATWTALHAIAGGYDGYLRWAVNSWTADPLRDSRFRTWAAGDTYSIYPGPRSSIRFERLVEGIQDCEKIRILREELAAKGAKGKLNKLNKAVAKFTPEGLSETQQSAAEMVNELNKLLNSL